MERMEISDHQNIEENGLQNQQNTTQYNNQVNVREVDNEEREITQTDHLNKKLLSSFLDRLNEASAGSSSTSSNPTTGFTDVSKKNDENNPTSDWSN
jgi:hypothetical protein